MSTAVEKIDSIKKTDGPMPNIDTIHMLGESHLFGLGVPRDVNTALELLQAAADLGNMKSCCLLGEAYYNGTVVPRDDAKAFKLFKKAHMSGCIEGTTKFGLCYSEGRGVQKDDGKALELFKLAASAGDLTAKSILTLSRFKTFNGVSSDAKLSDEEIRGLESARRVIDSVKDSIATRNVFEHVMNCDSNPDTIVKLRDLLNRLKQAEKIIECNKPQKAGDLGLACSDNSYTFYFVSKKNCVPATLAHFAAAKGRVDILQVLYEFGIDLRGEVADSTYNVITPYDVAKINCHEDAARFLLDPKMPMHTSVDACIIS